MRKIDPVKHAEKRKEILAAAERCFANKGFHGTTIAQICAEARISPGHLYHYFASKEAIIGAITATGLEYTTSRLEEITEGGNAIAVLISEFERLRDLHTQSRPGVLLDILAEAGRTPSIGKNLQDTSREMRRLLAEFLRQGQARGQIDADLDIEVAAAVLISMIDSFKTLSIRYPGLDPDRTTKVIETMITRFMSLPETGLRPVED